MAAATAGLAPVYVGANLVIPPGAPGVLVLYPDVNVVLAVVLWASLRALTLLLLSLWLELYRLVLWPESILHGTATGILVFAVAFTVPLRDVLPDSHGNQSFR